MGSVLVTNIPVPLRRRFLDSGAGVVVVRKAEVRDEAEALERAGKANDSAAVQHKA